MFTLKVRESFDAAHQIPGHKGKCKNIHGHTYQAEAEFEGEVLDELGMVIDFADLKKVLREMLPDHQFLNDVIDGPTTVEYLSKWLFEKVKARGLPITAMSVWENQGCGCRYTEDR